MTEDLTSETPEAVDSGLKDGSEITFGQLKERDLAIGSEYFGIWEQRYGASRGLTRLQQELVRSSRAFQPLGDADANNLLITGPTSSGKTLCAELLMAHHLTNADAWRVPRGCIYAVPLRALVTEKHKIFKATFGSRVYRSFRDFQDDDPKILHEDFDVVVVVYEKLYRWLFDREDAGKKLLHKTGLIIVDEVHMLADNERGPKLELMLAGLRYDQRVAEGRFRGRLVMLGPSQEALQDIEPWLTATPISIDEGPDDRPVPLAEGYLEVGQTPTFVRFPNGLKVIPRDDNERDHEGNDCSAQEILKQRLSVQEATSIEDLIPGLIQRIVGNRPGAGERVLVYCRTKDAAERLAADIAVRLAQRRDVQALSSEQLAYLDASGVTYLEPDRQVRLSIDIVPYGVAFHHRDLAPATRNLIEQLFDPTTSKGAALDVLVCTPTLLMGVDLPADYLLLTSTHSPRSQRTDWQEAELLSALDYRNYAGRVGRLGRQQHRPDEPYGVVLFVTDRDGKEAKAASADAMKVINSSITPIMPGFPQSGVGFETLALAIIQWHSPYAAADPVTERLFQGLARRTFTGHEAASLFPDIRITVHQDGLKEPLTVNDAATQVLTNLREAYSDLVEHRADGTYRITNLGAAVAQTNIHVRTYGLLTSIAKQITSIPWKPLWLLEMLLDAPEIDTMYPKDTLGGTGYAQVAFQARQLHTLRAFFRAEHNGEHVTEIARPGLLAMIENARVDQTHLQRWVRLALMWLWISGEDPQRIAEQQVTLDEDFPAAQLFPGTLRYGQISEMADQLEWLASALPLIWKNLGESLPQTDPPRSEEDIDDEIELFQDRLKYGLPERLVPLARLGRQDWARQQLMDLWNLTANGWQHPVELLNPKLALSTKEVDRERISAIEPFLDIVKTEIRNREWADHPQGTPGQQISRARRVVAESSTASVSASWPRILASLYLAGPVFVRNELAEAIDEALTSLPQPFYSRRLTPTMAAATVADLAVDIDGVRVGVKVVPAANDERVTAVDLAQAMNSPLTDENNNPFPFVVYVADRDLATENGNDLSQFSEVIAAHHGAGSLLTREALAQLLSRAITTSIPRTTSATEQAAGPEATEAAADDVRPIRHSETASALLKGTRSVVLRTALDVDDELYRGRRREHRAHTRASRGYVRRQPVKPAEQSAQTSPAFDALIEYFEQDIRRNPSAEPTEVEWPSTIGTVVSQIQANLGQLSAEQIAKASEQLATAAENIVRSGYWARLQRAAPADWSATYLLDVLRGVNVLSSGEHRAGFMALGFAPANPTMLNLLRQLDGTMQLLHWHDEQQNWARELKLRRKSIAKVSVDEIPSLESDILINGAGENRDYIHSARLDNEADLRAVQALLERYLDRHLPEADWVPFLETLELYPNVQALQRATWSPQMQVFLVQECLRLRGWMRALKRDRVPRWLFEEIVYSHAGRWVPPASFVIPSHRNDKLNRDYVHAPIRLVTDLVSKMYEETRYAKNQIVLVMHERDQSILIFERSDGLGRPDSGQTANTIDLLKCWVKDHGGSFADKGSTFRFTFRIRLAEK